MLSKYILDFSVLLMLIISMQLLIACRTAVVHRADKNRMDLDTGSSGKSHVAVQTEPEGCVGQTADDAKQVNGQNFSTLQGVCTVFFCF
jgi:hypothetical protein